jgi:hypothetical protein
LEGSGVGVDSAAVASASDDIGSGSGSSGSTSSTSSGAADSGASDSTIDFVPVDIATIVCNALATDLTAGCVSAQPHDPECGRMQDLLGLTSADRPTHHSGFQQLTHTKRFAQQTVLLKPLHRLRWLLLHLLE